MSKKIFWCKIKQTNWNIYMYRKIKIRGKSQKNRTDVSARAVFIVRDFPSRSVLSNSSWVSVPSADFRKLTFRPSLTCGTVSTGSSIAIMLQLTLPSLCVNFWPKPNDTISSSILLSWLGPLWFLFIPSNAKRLEMKTVCECTGGKTKIEYKKTSIKGVFRNIIILILMKSISKLTWSYK